MQMPDFSDPVASKELLNPVWTSIQIHIAQFCIEGNSDVLNEI